MTTLAISRLPKISLKQILFFLTAILLPLVWITPASTWAQLRNLLPAAQLAREMYYRGDRTSLSIRKVPDEVLRMTVEIAKDSQCFMTQISSITLDRSTGNIGYESILRCPDGPELYVGVYFDAQGRYLDTISAGTE